jgi:hypothetical protein
LNQITDQNYRLHRLQQGTEGKTMSFLFIIEQQFRAEKSPLSDRLNNELLFINLATARAEGILFPHLLQGRKTLAANYDHTL